MKLNLKQYKDRLTEAGGVDFDTASNGTLSAKDIDESLMGI
mgnify:CR=1 FL=1